MSQTPSSPDAADPASASPTVVVKKYANRRLYNTESSSYITLDTLAEMVRAGRDFVVYDAKTSDDITRSVLTQIIVEEESKGEAMLPTPFLRQLIGLYGGTMQGLVPRYLEQTMGVFAEQQQRVRSAMQQTIAPFMPPGFEEVGRQNIAMLERAMSLFAAPFYRQSGTPQPAGAAEAGPAAPDRDADRSEIEALRAEVDSLRLQLADTRSPAAVSPAGPEPAPQPGPDPVAAHPAEPVLRPRPKAVRSEG